jgi:predicted nuclease with TOPRIM domain
MENLSNEELVKLHDSNIVAGLTIHSFKAAANTRKELLSRLTRLEEVEKENKELKEKDLYWRKRVTELEENENRFPTLAEFSNLQDDYEQTSKENDELRKQVENLKCCGNCINYIYDMEEDHHYCNKNIFHGKRHAGICSNNWQSDTMTREERK